VVIVVIPELVVIQAYLAGAAIQAYLAGVDIVD
jgi:hypothetical protein